ncbi:hypothetical protein MKEN_00211200 [Mycena kentingensis (nom. inval.)]|nr:hypothetical protein MKEN_00211200 [Mycena kentingensis (nom. inval.)]
MSSDDDERDSEQSEDGQSEDGQSEEGNVASQTTEQYHRIPLLAQLQTLLDADFTFSGAFAWSKQYALADAPTPCLNIDGLGPVGLPLSSRDAQCLIDASSSGEIPARKFRFDNIQWDSWLRETVLPVLASSLSLQGPTLTLQKLVLQTPDSAEISSHTTPQRDGVTGQLVVLLPSSFDGGKHTIRDGAHSKEFDVSPLSGLSTTLIAAYSDVEHTVSRVSSGYSLSLVYDILQSSAAVPRPAFPDMSAPVAKLRALLSSWQDDDSDEPPYIGCILRGKYARGAEFSAASLTGADDLLLRHLAPIASDLGLSLHLVHLEGRYWSPCEARGQTPPTLRDSDCEDYGESEYWVAAEEVVDLDGMPVEVPDLEEKWEDDGAWDAVMVGGPFETENLKPDTVEFEATEDRFGQRTSIWRRCALLIWPSQSELQNDIRAGDLIDYAFYRLGNSVSTSATTFETRVVEHLLECCHSPLKSQDGFVEGRQAKKKAGAQRARAMLVLRRCAERWKDAALLDRALDACGAAKDLTVIGIDGVLSAYFTLGWAALVSFCTRAMKADRSNDRRRQLLRALPQISRTENDSDLAGWIEEQTQAFLGRLGTLKVDDIPWFVELAATRDAHFFNDTLLPQIMKQNAPLDVWIALVSNIYKVPSLRACIAQCADPLIDRLPPFPFIRVQERRSYITQEVPAARDIARVFKLGVDVGLPSLCANVFAKMREAARHGSFDAKRPPWVYYELLMQDLEEWAPAPALEDAELREIMRTFFRDVIAALLDGKGAPCPLDSAQMAFVLCAIERSGGIPVLKNLTADSFAKRDTDIIQRFVRAAEKRFPRENLATEDDRLQYDATKDHLVKLAIDAFEFPAAVTGDALNGKMIQLLRFCIDIHAESQLEYALLRFSSPPAGSTLPEHLERVLGPFIPALAEFLRGIERHFTMAPFKKFSAAVTRNFAEKVVGDKPAGAPTPEEIEKAVECICDDCSELRQFLSSGRKASHSFVVAKSYRDHLEVTLAATRRWGVDWETIRVGTPHTLKVTKPAAMLALSCWTANVAQGKRIMESLGDDEVQRSVLGGEYDAVWARLEPERLGDAPAASGRALKRNQSQSAGVSSAKKVKSE